MEELAQLIWCGYPWIWEARLYRLQGWDLFITYTSGISVSSFWLYYWGGKKIFFWLVPSQIVSSDYRFKRINSKNVNLTGVKEAAYRSSKVRAGTQPPISWCPVPRTPCHVLGMFVPGSGGSLVVVLSGWDPSQLLSQQLLLWSMFKFESSFISGRAERLDAKQDLRDRCV